MNFLCADILLMDSKIQDILSNVYSIQYWHFADVQYQDHLFDW